MLRTAWSFGACEPYSLELAEFISERLPWVDQVRFVSSGTEAVMSALRLARGATSRGKVLKFEGCYHGHADSLLVKAGSGLAQSEGTGHSALDSAGVTENSAKDTLVCPLDDEAALERAFNEHGKDIAAVIIEPLPANFGLLVQRKEFLDKVAKMTRDNGSLLIFDEVISGFRITMGGMAEAIGISPDLVTYGKIIGGGFPVGCFGGRKEIMEQMAPAGPVYQAGTLSANPVSVTAGLATLRKVEELEVLPKINARTKTFADNINSFLQEKEIPLNMTCFGSLFWMHPKSDEPPRRVQDLPSDHAQTFTKIFWAAVKSGLYLAPSAFEVGFTSWAHTEEILANAETALKQAVASAYEKV
jgi:glutamate-1-semialdehyde 2,1-aminomutase